MKKRYLIFSFLLTSILCNKAFAELKNTEIGNSIQTSYDKRIKQETNFLENSFTPYGEVGTIFTIYGNSGKYKTATAHPMLYLDYTFTPQWSLFFEWNRLMNIYSGEYEKDSNKANHNFSVPKGYFEYIHKNFFDTKAIWRTQIGARQTNFFKDSDDKYWTWISSSLDFYKYFPKSENFEVLQFAIQPLYYYGSFVKSNPNGHMNHVALNLLTQFKIYEDFKFQFNGYLSKEWYNGDFKIDKKEEMNYFAIVSWLEYSKNIYQFNKRTNLQFNFATGFDPYIFTSSSEKNWKPTFWIINHGYGWLWPTKLDSDKSYSNMFNAFVLPQLKIIYNHSEDLTMDLFVQVKYSNQVWGSSQKDWKLQPQGGVGITYRF